MSLFCAETPSQREIHDSQKWEGVDRQGSQTGHKEGSRTGGGRAGKTKVCFLVTGCVSELWLPKIVESPPIGWYLMLGVPH